MYTKGKSIFFYNYLNAKDKYKFTYNGNYNYTHIKSVNNFSILFYFYLKMNCEALLWKTLSTQSLNFHEQIRPEL